VKRTKRKFKKGDIVKHFRLDLTGRVLGYSDKWVWVMWESGTVLDEWVEDGLDPYCEDPEDQQIKLSRLHKVLI
jgi:hypothetical protein